MENRVNTMNHLQKSYTFLDYEVLPELREIHRVKTPIKMSKKSFDILLVLIENQGCVVTKEQLIEQVWPNQVVTDAALNKQIARLRNDLVGSETTQPIIETVRGVGIRLVPPVNQLEKENPNIHNNNSKKWWWVAVAVIVALFSYTQFKKESTADSQIVLPTLSLQDTMVEIRSAMSINKKAFISQIKRRNELGDMLNKRFDIEKDLSWERRFIKYHDKMNEGELFVFSQIRAYTEGPLLSSNQQILDLINAKKEIIDEIPSADKLRNHLILWLNKYHKVFKNNPKMSLLYVGVEDGAPYPSEVDEQVVNWLEQHNDIPQANTSVSLNVAVVPSEKASDWLNVDGLKYFSALLSKHTEIHAISPSSEWFTNDNLQSLAVELSQSDKIDYVLNVNNSKVKGNYIADVILRNEDKVLAKEVLESKSISLLFDKIDFWVTRQLTISTTIAKGKLQNYKPTDFALESYLKGLEIGRHESFKKSIPFLKAAINDDPKFFYVQILLAEVEAELGSKKKALAILDTLAKQENFDTSLLNYLYNVKALTLVYLNQIDEAKVALNQSIELSQKKNDMVAIIKSLTTKAMIELNTGKVSMGTVNILKKQLELVKNYNPTSYAIALSCLNLASIYQTLGKSNEAITYIDMAIVNYDKSNNNRGIIGASTILANIYNDLAKPSKGLLVLENSKSHYDKLSSLQTKRDYLYTMANTQIDVGFFKQALVNIRKLKEMNINYQDSNANFLALLLQIEKSLIQNKPVIARESVTELLIIKKNDLKKFTPGQVKMIMLYDMNISALMDEPQESRKKIDYYIQSDQNFKELYSIKLDLFDAIICYKEGFKSKASKILHEIVTKLINAHKVKDALLIGYKLLDILWENDIDDYVKTMNYLDELSTFKYPMDKYKAQYMAYNKDYINAYALMAELKPRSNEFWTTQDQIKLEEYQELAQQK